MTNLNTKIVILAISALIVSLTGCKKEEDKYGSFTLETSSMDFEWGQTKELAFSAQYITSFNISIVPVGWTCVQSGNKFIITAPESTDSPNPTEIIEFSAETNTGSTITRRLTVAIKIATLLDRVANCIIVSDPGRRFKFNALKKGEESSETITGAVSATRLWATNTSGIINVSLEDGYLYFATGNAYRLIECNAVVAVTDKDGNILWSWHIWVTDYNPSADFDVFDDMRVMNRNLGAFANSGATSADAVRSFGLYYQWGRKDPFVGPSAWNSNVPQSIYNGYDRYVNYVYVVSDDNTGTLDYAIANPGTFIAGNRDNNFDWLASSNTNLWSKTSKTLYDPCPVGWRVAPSDIWREFTTTGSATSDLAEFNVEGEYKYGWTFVNGENRIFYPAAGRRSFSPTLARNEDNYTNVVNDGEGVGYPVGFYWSSTYPIPSAATTGRTGSLVFRNNYVNPAYAVNEVSEQAPAGGFPVRCVAE